MAKIDELIAQAKPPVIQKRKGNDPLRAKEKRPSEPGKALVEEGTRAYEVAKMLREGSSVHDIAVKYGISKSEINHTLGKALSALAEDVAPVILNWSVMTISRLEDLIGKLYPKLMDSRNNPNDVVYARIQNLIAQEKDIISLLMAGSKSKDILSDLSETMRADGKLYEEGKQALNEKLHNGVIEREQPIADLDNPFPDGIIYQPQSAR